MNEEQKVLLKLHIFDNDVSERFLSKVTALVIFYMYWHQICTVCVKKDNKILYLFKYLKIFNRIEAKAPVLETIEILYRADFFVFVCCFHSS